MRALLLAIITAVTPAPKQPCFKGFIGTCGSLVMSAHSELSGLIVEPGHCEIYPGECGKGFDIKGAVIVDEEWLGRCNYGMGP